MKILNFVLGMIAVLLVIDVMILFTMLMGIAAGDPNVVHVPFWDAQIKFIVSFLA